LDSPRVLRVIEELAGDLRRLDQRTMAYPARSKLCVDEMREKANVARGACRWLSNEAQQKPPEGVSLAVLAQYVSGSSKAPRECRVPERSAQQD
jgi:hypothetical protein